MEPQYKLQSTEKGDLRFDSPLAFSAAAAADGNKKEQGPKTNCKPSWAFSKGTRSGVSIYNFEIALRNVTDSPNSCRRTPYPVFSLSKYYYSAAYHWCTLLDTR